MESEPFVLVVPSRALTLSLPMYNKVKHRQLAIQGLVKTMPACRSGMYRRSYKSTRSAQGKHAQDETSAVNLHAKVDVYTIVNKPAAVTFGMVPAWAVSDIDYYSR